MAYRVLNLLKTKFINKIKFYIGISSFKLISWAILEIQLIFENWYWKNRYSNGKITKKRDFFLMHIDFFFFCRKCLNLHHIILSQFKIDRLISTGDTDFFEKSIFFKRWQKRAQSFRYLLLNEGFWNGRHWKCFLKFWPEKNKVSRESLVFAPLAQAELYTELFLWFICSFIRSFLVHIHITLSSSHLCSNDVDVL